MFIVLLMCYMKCLVESHYVPVHYTISLHTVHLNSVSTVQAIWKSHKGDCKKVKAHMSEPKAQTPRAYPSFFSMKHAQESLGVLLLPRGTGVSTSQGYSPHPQTLLHFVSFHPGVPATYCWERKQRGGRGLNPGPPDPGIRGVHHLVRYASQNLAKPWGFLVCLFLFLTFFPAWKFCKIGGPRNLEIGVLNFKKTCEQNTPIAISSPGKLFLGAGRGQK